MANAQDLEDQIMEHIDNITRDESGWVYKDVLERVLSNVESRLDALEEEERDREE